MMISSRYLFKSSLLSLLLLIFNGGGLMAQQQAAGAPIEAARKFMMAYQYDSAVNVLLPQLQQDSLFQESAWLLGQCYSQLGRTALAKKALEQLLHQQPEHVPARVLLGQLYLKEANYNKSAACFDYLLQNDTTNTFFYKQRAFIAEKAGHISLAVAQYQKALTLRADDVESIAALAALKSRSAENDEAAVLVAQGLSQDSTNIGLWRLRAKLAYQQKDYAATLQAMAYPVAHGDTAHYYIQLLAISHFHLKNHEKAVQWLEFLLQQGMDTEVVNYYLGLSYRNSGNPDKGIVYLEKAAKKGVSEHLSHYYTQLAVTYEEQGDYRNAIQAYQLAYKGSADTRLLYHLARSYDQHYKDKRVALRYYEKYLSQIDTVNTNYQDYARYRVKALKENIHFSADTL